MMISIRGRSAMVRDLDAIASPDCHDHGLDPPFRPSHIISITSAMALDAGNLLMPQQVAAYPHLHLQFDDGEWPHPSWTLPTQQQIDQVVVAARRWADDCTWLAVHCSAGRSRSPAVAMVFASWVMAPTRAASLILADCPHAMPNRLIMRLGNRALGLGPLTLERAWAKACERAGIWCRDVEQTT